MSPTKIVKNSLFSLRKLVEKLHLEKLHLKKLPS